MFKNYLRKSVRNYYSYTKDINIGIRQKIHAQLSRQFLIYLRNSIFNYICVCLSQWSSKSSSSTASIRDVWRGSKMMRKRLGEKGGGLAGSQWRVGGWRGTLRGWKSIPLDGVTSRAQLALARVSFRRGFRVLTVVHWRFLPVVSFLLRR